jgi:hypothetical protein
MTRNEQEMYSNIDSIAKSLEKIAKSLESNKTETTKDIPGFEGTLDALNNLCNVSTKDEEYDDDVHNDYLNDLIQNMNHIEYLNFHHDMAFGFASNDTTALNNHIYELEYEECIDAIKRALLITGDSEYIAYAGGDEEAGRNFVKERIKQENTTDPYADDPNLEVQMNQDDPYTYEPNPNRDKGEPALIEYLDGVVNDSDHDIRSTAKMYFELLESTDLGNPDAYKFRTKKDCILDYVTNEFGSHGARYTDIIKFAYYLGCSNTPKYTSANRGYYSIAFSPRMDGHLIQGGKDYFVKGINKEGKERYFALSFVESATDYWKEIS